MLQTSKGYGGNVLPKQCLTVRRTAAFGDALVATIIVDKLAAQGYNTVFQTSPFIENSLRSHPSIGRIEASQGLADINLDGCYEKDPDRKTRHFHHMFMESAQRQLTHRQINLGPAVNCRPTLPINQNNKEIAAERLKPYPKPWVFICPRSDSYVVRQVPDGVWREAAKNIHGTKFWLGRHPAPIGIEDLEIKYFEQIIDWLPVADLLVTVDTGPMHFAAALGVPVLAIGQSSDPELHLSDQRDFSTIYPKLDCLNCQLNVCPITRWLPPCQYIEGEMIAEAVNPRLLALNKKRVTALIPTFKPTLRRLQRCLDAVLPQVDEVVMTMAQDALLPNNPPSHPKLRYVRKQAANLGFGKNVNFGFRHTNSPWVLLLNDDVYLQPDAVEKLKHEINPGVGMIAHLLRYESGRIYFAGRQRRPGERGATHIDHNAWLPTITKPAEMEAVSATSLLIRRSAFYDCGGFDERFHMYAEDDDLSLRMRQKGWKLMYTPHALGTHEGSATSREVGNTHQWIADSGRLMEGIWGWYWDKNRDVIPGQF